MNKYVATAGVAVALVGGSLALTVVNPLTLAGAQDTTTSTEQVAPDPAVPAEGAERVSPLDSALSELVAEGTITQEQADAIQARTQEKREAFGDEHPGRGGHGGRGFGGFDALRETADAIAGQLGITADELRDALVSGSSLNDLTAEHGVDPAAISQTLVDAANARIDAAVTDGKLTQEQADEAKTKLSENIAGIMEGSIKGLGHGPGRPPVDAPAEDGEN